MGWRSRYSRYFPYRPESYPHPFKPFKINERCFIRKEHKCGKMFGASKSCFVACPSEEEIKPLLELSSEKLSKLGIEAVIAVRERAYGQDIFCTKICGKIIESQFCLVILDDQITKVTNIPNPNVYYEYGLMTSLGKHIIPLQKEDLTLAFNIQSHDTIKYNNSNMAAELDRAFRDAVRITEAKGEEEKQTTLPEKSILRSIELAGFELKDRDWFLSDVIADTGFKGLGQHEIGFYAYLGKVDEDEEMQTYLEDLNVVVYRTEKFFEKLQQEIVDLKMEKVDMERQMEEAKEEKNWRIVTDIEYDYEKKFVRENKIGRAQSKIDLMKKMYIAFLIDSKIDSSSFMVKAKGLIVNHPRFTLVRDKDNEIVFGDVKVSLFVPSL